MICLATYRTVVSNLLSCPISPKCGLRVIVEFITIEYCRLLKPDDDQCVCLHIEVNGYQCVYIQGGSTCGTCLGECLSLDRENQQKIVAHTI